MEQAAVLAREIERNDCRLCLLHKLRREHFPWQIQRLAEPSWSRRDATRREDNDGNAFLEQPQRLVADCDVVFQRFLGIAEVYWQRIGLHLPDLEQVLMDHDPEWAPELLGQRQNRDAIANAKRVVGDKNQGAVRQIPGRPLVFAPDRDVDKVEHPAENPVAGRHYLPPPNVIETCIAVATRKAFDRPDKPPLQARMVRTRVGKFGKGNVASKIYQHARVI